jgi:3'-5' exoribonuclease
MIASHHGRYEWQSPKMPKTIEAVLLHHIDLLDGEAYKIVAETSGRESGWSWSRLLERWVYTPEAADECVDTDGDDL